MNLNNYSLYRGAAVVLEFFEAGDYTPQGHGHIDEFVRGFCDDLLEVEDSLANAARRGELVAERNFSPIGQPFQRDVDLAIGSPEGTPQRRLGGGSLPSANVEEVWLACNIETLVSSVGKNLKNRGEDIHSFYLGVYQASSLAATGCLVVLNVADIDGDPKETIDKFRGFALSEGGLGQNLDALAVLPIHYDDDAPAETEVADEYVDQSDELHYDQFIETLASALKRRFEGEYRVTEESLQSILSQDETDVLEFKGAIPEDAQTIRKEIAAFANHDGGTLLLGVDDDTGEAIGLEDIDETEERVAGLIDPLPSSTIDSMERATVQGKDVLIVNVNRATEAPVEYYDRFPIRSGTTTTYLTGREIVERFPRAKYSAEKESGVED